MKQPSLLDRRRFLLGAAPAVTIAALGVSACSSTASPPPAYNFALLPQVQSLDAFWAMKQRGPMRPAERYESIEMPKNSANGFVTAFFAVVTGFALIWHIGWLAVLGLVCAALTLLAFGWVERVEQEVSGEQLADDERIRLQPMDSA
jgi:cytochrome o ubiquinol oxidase subunit 1